MQVDKEVWKDNEIPYSGVLINEKEVNLWETGNHFQHRVPIPQFYEGELEDCDIAPEEQVGFPTLEGQSSYDFLARCKYHVSLTRDFGDEGIIGVKVS